MVDEKNTGTPVENPNSAASPATPGAQPGAVTPDTSKGDAKPDTSTGDEKPTEESMVPLAALHEEREKRQGLQTELDNLRTAAETATTATTTAPGAAPDQGLQDYRAQVDKMWEDDPKKAVQAEIMMGLNWLDNVNNTVETQMDGLAIKDTTFSNYRPMVRNYIRSLPLDQRSKPGIVEVALHVVKGQNIDTIIQKTKDDLYEKFQKGELAGTITPPTAGTYSQPAPTTGVALSDEQRAVAQAMGLTDEQYASQIKK